MQQLNNRKQIILYLSFGSWFLARHAQIMWLPKTTEAASGSILGHGRFIIDTFKEVDLLSFLPYTSQENVPAKIFQ